MDVSTCFGDVDSAIVAGAVDWQLVSRGLGIVNFSPRRRVPSSGRGIAVPSWGLAWTQLGWKN